MSFCGKTNYTKFHIKTGRSLKCSVSVPRLGPVLAKCFDSCWRDCDPMPAVLAAGLGPLYLGRFWGVIHPMSMPSLATAAGPSYFIRPAGSGPLPGQTVLATWVSLTAEEWIQRKLDGATWNEKVFQELRQ